MINNLTEEELALTLYVVNILLPTSNLEITPTILKSYKYKFLVQKLLAAKNLVNEEGKPIYISLLNKLKIPVPEGYEAK